MLVFNRLNLRIQLGLNRLPPLVMAPATPAPPPPRPWQRRRSPWLHPWRSPSTATTAHQQEKSSLETPPPAMLPETPLKMIWGLQINHPHDAAINPFPPLFTERNGLGMLSRGIGSPLPLTPLLSKSFRGGARAPSPPLWPPLTFTFKFSQHCISF